MAAVPPFAGGKSVAVLAIHPQCRYNVPSTLNLGPPADSRALRSPWLRELCCSAKSRLGHGVVSRSSAREFFGGVLFRSCFCRVWAVEELSEEHFWSGHGPLGHRRRTVLRSRTSQRSLHERGPDHVHHRGQVSAELSHRATCDGGNVTQAHRTLRKRHTQRC